MPISARRRLHDAAALSSTDAVADRRRSGTRRPSAAGRAASTRVGQRRRCRTRAPRRSGTKAAALRAMARSISLGGRTPSATGAREVSTMRSKSLLVQQAARCASRAPGRSPRRSTARQTRSAGAEIFHGQPQAVFAARVRRADLDHHHVAFDVPVSDQRRRAASRAPAGCPARRHRPARGWCRCRNTRRAAGDRRARGLHDAGVARAEEALPRRRAAARCDDERLDQRLRLGARLSPDDSVAGTHYTCEVHHRDDYGRRENARPDSAQGALARRFHGPAGAGRDAARGARADEMGPDQRQQPADARALSALEGVAREAAAGAGADQRSRRR